MRALLEFIQDEPLQARLALVEVQTAGPAALARYDKSIDEVAAFLRNVREKSDVADELPETLEIAVAGGLYWFLQQRVTVGEATNAAELLPEALEIVAEPYLGASGTRELIEAI